MSTTLHSFMDIFETTIEDGDTSVQLNKIVIPLIQRDYAQGRIDKDMQTKTQWSQNTYMPYLKEADDDHLSRDEMGQYLVYDDVYIVCENNSYGVYRNDDDSLTDTVTISQNEAGIDTEDRIIKLKKYIANMK